LTRPDHAPLSAPARPALVDRQQLRDELRQRRETFHAILDSSSTHELLKPSNGTRWNNEELLFHMLFGYVVVVALIRMIKVLGLLPPPATKPLAFVLNASSRPFNAINYWGSRLGAKLYNHRRMGPKFDRVAASLATTLDRTSEASLRRGMHYPTRWDPFFKEYMTLADVFHYPTQHFDFHQRQLQLDSAQPHRP
jgi:DinB superfamily